MISHSVNLDPWNNWFIIGYRQGEVVSRNEVFAKTHRHRVYFEFVLTNQQMANVISNESL